MNCHEFVLMSHELPWIEIIKYHELQLIVMMPQSWTMMSYCELMWSIMKNHELHIMNSCFWIRLHAQFMLHFMLHFMLGFMLNSCFNPWLDSWFNSCLISCFCGIEFMIQGVWIHARIHAFANRIHARIHVGSEVPWWSVHHGTSCPLQICRWGRVSGRDVVLNLLKWSLD